MTEIITEEPRDLAVYYQAYNNVESSSLTMNNHNVESIMVNNEYS